MSNRGRSVATPNEYAYAHPGLALVLVSMLVSMLVSGLAMGCDPSGGDRGAYWPDMTWGPASNSLYNPEVDWVERFCEHVHVTCQEDPEDYSLCLLEWRYYQQVCPFEVEALLPCIDALYDCGDYSTWEWWEMITAACAPEISQFEQCLSPYMQ